MYSIPLLFILNLQLRWSFGENILCHYNFKQSYPKDESDSNTVGFFNSSHIYYCPAEDVLTSNISFTVNQDPNNPGFPNFLKVAFPPPKRECMLGVTLLVNPLIQDEETCSKYNFVPYNDYMIHGIERNLCVFKYDNPIEIKDENFLYKDKIWTMFSYIFTGCYALRFQVNRKQKYEVADPIFINSIYKRTEVIEPQFICKYIEYPTDNSPEKSQMTNFTINVSIEKYTGFSLYMALISQLNKDPSKDCKWCNEPILFEWTTDLEVDTQRKKLTDEHCVVKYMETIKGDYKKSVHCNFQIEAPGTNSCFIYHVLDDRCHVNTVWKPVSKDKNMPCTWIRHCERSLEHWQYVAYDGIVAPSILIQPDTTLFSAKSYLLLPIVAVVLIVSAIIGILCFRRYLRIRKEEIKHLYENPRQDDCLKATNFDIIDNSEKEIDHDNPSCNNIVLLYTNSSTSFMTLMKDFRKTLAKMCSCTVYDWHDGAAWNEVAKVGAVSWFTELLNNGCRVIWIDTPATRSVISKSRDDESSLDKLSKYYEIHDFRDMAFRGVLEVAKSKVDDVARQYHRHFVVRFEGLQSTANVNDPFLDLSPHARYYMPQHFMQLCSDLSLVKPEIFKRKTKLDEDIYRLFVYQLYKSQTQQRLKSMKTDSTL